MSWNIAKPGDQINGPVAVTGNLNVDSNTLFVDSANNRVGVLTASPTVPLDVVGDAKVSGNLTVDTNTLVVDAANNRLGIGTATPAASLQVGTRSSSAVANNSSIFTAGGASASAGTTVAATFANTVAAAVGNEAQITFTPASNYSATGAIGTAITSTTNGESALKFYTYHSSVTGLTERLRIASDGVCTWSNVGGVAGTRMTLNATGLGVGVSPTVPLDVVGAGKISGALTVEGQNVNSAIRAAASDYAGVNFDGATSGTRVTSTLTGQNIGTGDLSIWLRVKVPAVGQVQGFVYGAVCNNAGSGFDTTGSFLITQELSGSCNVFGYVSGVFTQAIAVSGFAANYAGQVVDLVLTRATVSGTSTLTLYVNGSSSGTSTGAVAAQNVTTNYFHTGVSAGNQPKFQCYRSVLFNRALSAADIADLIANGINPADQWGTQAAVVSGATGNGYLETWTVNGVAGTSNGAATDWSIETGLGDTITRNSTSPIGGTYDAIVTTSSTVGGYSALQKGFSAFSGVNGKRYRVSFSYKGVSGAGGNLTTRLVPGNAYNTNHAVTVGSTLQSSTEVILGEAGSTTFRFIYTERSSSLQIDNVTITRIGAIVDLDFTVGLGDQAYDRSTNNLDGTLTGGVSWTVPKDEPVPFIDGTAAIPAITNAGDTNTGLYFPAADTVAATTGGVERLRIDSAGQVGIGVTPSAWSSSSRSLQVGRAFTIFANTGSNDSVLTNNAFWDGSNYKFIQNGWATRVVSNTSGSTQWGVSTISGTAGDNVSWSNIMTLTATGRLGIGTTTTAAQFHVNGTDTTVALINGATKGIRFAFTSGTSLLEGVDNTGSISFQPLRIHGSELTFQTSITDRLRIKSTGQVNFVGLASDPAGAAAGDVYYNTTTNKLKCYNGTTWNDLF